MEVVLIILAVIAGWFLLSFIINQLKSKSESCPMCGNGRLNHSYSPGFINFLCPKCGHTFGKKQF